MDSNGTAADYGGRGVYSMNDSWVRIPFDEFLLVWEFIPFVLSCV
jgi:hypothetical protein